MITITNEDNIALMARYPDQYFDLAIVDPPYGIGADVAHARVGRSQSKGWASYRETDWDSSIPNKEYFDELFRVSKNQIVFGGNYMTEYLPPSMGWIIWNKKQRGFTLADGEMAWTSFNRALRIFDFSRGAAMQENNIGLKKFHPTAKPISLYKWILDKYAKPGQKILDTHLGSGSIAIACHDYKFDLVACEIDPEYYELTQKRLSHHTSQIQMF